MKRIEAAVLGVDHGSILLFSHFEEGGPMWSETGPRVIRRPIAFSEPFRSEPTVMVAPAMWDIDQASNQRADLTAQSVTCAGFVLQFKTWGDTRVARIRATWTAIGALAHEDDWDVD